MADDPIVPETPVVPVEGADLGAAQAAELERVKVALKAANKEAAERRKRLEELEAQDEARRKAEMTEAERLKAEVTQAKQEAEQARADARATLIRAAFVAEAAKAGASHPEDVYRLADISGIEVGADGTVAGVTEAVKALVDAGRVPLTAGGRPLAPKLDGGAGGGDRSHDAIRLTPLEADLAQKMGLTAEQYQKNKAAIAART